MRWGRAVLLALPVLVAGGYAGYIGWLGLESDQPSRCYGRSALGHLEGGRRLPYAGDNFSAYSLFGFVTGRTFMHGTVRDVVRESYAELNRSHPELRFVYAEGSWPWGGRLSPHRTHRNGTAIDFHVPVRTADGTISTLPTSVFNLFGYALDFDKSGKSGDYTIDFEAIGLHLLALQKAARARDIPVRLVIFDVNLQPKLAATKSGGQAVRQLRFNKAQAWVQHDEHYHVEFGVPCR